MLRPNGKVYMKIVGGGGIQRTPPSPLPQPYMFDQKAPPFQG